MVDQQVLGGPDQHDELDAFGRVIERTIDSTSESFTYQGTSEALVQSKVAGTATTFAQGPSGPIGYAKGQHPPHLYIKDLHSDVVAETRASGGGVDIRGASWYSPWGERESLDGSLGLLGFQGQPHTQLGDGPELVDMTTRYYQAGLGRFTTGDVLFGEVSDPMSLNRYGYALGSPVTYSDPSGMCVLDETTGECYQQPTDQGAQSGSGGGARTQGDDGAGTAGSSGCLAGVTLGGCLVFVAIGTLRPVAPGTEIYIPVGYEPPPGWDGPRWSLDGRSYVWRAPGDEPGLSEIRITLPGTKKGGQSYPDGLVQWRVRSSDGDDHPSDRYGNQVGRKGPDNHHVPDSEWVAETVPDPAPAPEPAPAPASDAQFSYPWEPCLAVIGLGMCGDGGSGFPVPAGVPLEWPGWITVPAPVPAPAPVPGLVF